MLLGDAAYFAAQGVEKVGRLMSKYLVHPIIRVVVVCGGFLLGAET